MSEYVLREARAGDAGLVVNFYYELFAQQFDFLPSTEQYFFHAMGDFFSDPRGNRLFVVEREGQIMGSVCIVRLGENEAQLRMFGISPALQGMGYGTGLMDAAMSFCREMDYRHIILWTIDICKAARHLYGKYGFRMTGTKPNNTWANYPMTEEKWEYHAKN